MDKYIHFNYTDKTERNICKLFKEVGYILAFKTNQSPIPVHKLTNNTFTKVNESTK